MNPWIAPKINPEPRIINQFWFLPKSIEEIPSAIPKNDNEVTNDTNTSPSSKKPLNQVGIMVEELGLNRRGVMSWRPNAAPIPIPQANETKPVPYSIPPLKTTIWAKEYL
jgi:hypothetical protein